MATEFITGSHQEIERLLCADFARMAAEAIAKRGAFRVVLAGGSIGALFFPALARLPIDWSHVDFFWADERAVPPGDPESNFGAAMRLWLEPAHVPPARIHRMRAEDPDLPGAAAAYSAELKQVAGDPPVLDFALLGVGPDGHVASLFPGRVEEAGLVAGIEDAPKEQRKRMTLTLSALAGVQRIVIAAAGAEKAGVIQRALHSASGTPLGALLERAPNAAVLLVK